MPRTPYSATKVPTAKTREQIEKLLSKGLGAQGIQWTILPSHTVVVWGTKRADGHALAYRIKVEPRRINANEYRVASVDQRMAQAMRALYYYLKSKVEAVEFGLVEANTEFLPFALVQGSEGRAVTVAEAIGEQVRSGTLDSQDPFAPVLPKPRPDSEKQHKEA